MTDREAMKLALEALEQVTKELLAVRDELAERGARPTTNVFHQRLWDSSFDAYTNHAMPAAQALRTAIAKAEKQEPVAWICYGAPGKRDIDFEEADINGLPIGTLLYAHPPAAQPAPVQEPVAKIVPCYTPSGKRVALNTEYQHLPIGTSLYTTPPAAQRQWVELTDEEVMEIAFNFDVPSPVVRTVEAKLREKNA